MSPVSRRYILRIGSLSYMLAAESGSVSTTGSDATLTYASSSALPEDMVFHSDFGTGTGTGDDALRDTDKTVPWSSTGGNGIAAGSLEVVASTDLDFPSTNCLRVSVFHRGDGGGLAANMVSDGDIPGLANDGDDLFYRWYVRVVAPEPYPSTDDQNHCIQNGQSGGASDWQMESVVNDNGTWEMTFNFSPTGWPNHRWSCPLLGKNETYRVELNIHRVSSTTYNAHIRVYDSDDVLLYDDDDFENVNGSATLADTPTLTFNDIANMDRLQGGFNGVQAGSGITDGNDGFVHNYQGCFAVRTDDWCGPYSSAEAT